MGLLKDFAEHRAALFRFAYRMTGSAADAEDIVQECFLQLLRPECSYDSERGNLRTYLFGVVRNQALKRQQSKSRETEEIEPMDAGESPVEEVLRREVAKVVARAVSLLPDSQKEILILAHYEQMPLAEIADVTGLELGAVKSRLQRARASLKEMLAVYVMDLEKQR